MQAPITFGKGLLTDDSLLLAESLPLNPMTLETLEAMYAAGLRDMPRTAATGCTAESVEENDVVVLGVALEVETAATALPRARFARSTSDCVSDL